MRYAITFILFFRLLFPNEGVVAQSVYVTPTGSKYHLENCSYARTANQILSISEANSRGYTPCSRCKPTEGKARLDYGQDPNISAYGCSSVRCRGYAKTQNRRCKRMTKNCNQYCFQHQK